MVVFWGCVFLGLPGFLDVEDVDFFRPRRFGGSGEVSEVGLVEFRGFNLWVLGRKKGVEMFNWGLKEWDC